MERDLRFPRALKVRLEFRRLAELCPRFEALDAVFSLWEFFADACQSNAVGRVSVADFRFLRMDGPTVDALIKAGFLVKDGEEMTCPMFREFNSHLDPAQVSQASKGGHAKSWNHLIRRAEEQQLDFVSPGDVLTDDGRMLTDLELRNCRVIIRGFDGVTSYSRGNSPGDWPRDLILQAHELDSRFGVARVQDVARNVYLSFRGNPRIPRTTELCIKSFEALRALVNSVQ